MPAYAGKQLTIYSALETEYLARYVKEFQKVHPDIKVVFIRESGGVIAARLMAEKNAPKADIVFGVGADTLLQMQALNLLKPYTPKNSELVAPQMRDPANPPHWVGFVAWETTFCINPIELEKRNLPTPSSWQDLTNPAYKGLIVMPNPASSGTGYMTIAAWLQLMGEEQGWEFMEQLHKNGKMYTHSGVRPAQMTAQGETVIGITTIELSRNLPKKGVPIQFMHPKEGLGWNVFSSALIKGSKNADSGKLFLDWILTSSEATTISVEYTGIPSIKEHVAEDVQPVTTLFIPDAIQFAAKNRERFLQEWQQRFESK